MKQTTTGRGTRKYISVNIEMAIRSSTRLESVSVNHFRAIAPLSLSYPSYRAVFYGKIIISWIPSPAIPPLSITKRQINPHVHRLQKCSLIAPTAHPPFTRPNPPRLLQNHKRTTRTLKRTLRTPTRHRTMAVDS